MFKKLMIVALAALSLSSARAQQAVGEWYLYPVFTSAISSLVDTPSKVYYLAASRLYSYDKDSNESYSYSTQNKLSDTNVTLIQYNRDKKYLFVAYDTGNIDLIYDSGKVVNLSDIVDANLTTDKGINAVAFKDNRIFVGTVFGLVVFDSDRHEVIESGIYNASVTCVTTMGDYLLIYPDNKTYQLLASKITDRHNTLDNFTQIAGYVPNLLYGVNDKYIVALNTDSSVSVAEIDLPNMTFKGRHKLTASVTTARMGETDDQFYFVTSDNKLASFAKNDTVPTMTALPSELSGQQIGFNKSLASVWGGDKNGIAEYDVTSGSAVILKAKSKPEAIATGQCAYIRASRDGSHIYLSNIGPTRFKSIGDTSGSEGYYLVQRSTVIINGVPKDANVTVGSADLAMDAENQVRNNMTGIMGGSTRFVVDSENPDRYYLGNGKEGVYVCENNEEVGKFKASNSPMIATWGIRALDVNMDPEGNLWVGSITNKTSVSPYIVLPKEKLKDPSTVTKADWSESKHKGVETGAKDMGSVICSHSNMMFTWDSTQGKSPYAYDTKGTWTDTSDDEIRQLTGMTDQDGKTFYADRWICAAEDQKGRVWFGTSAGIIEITNPSTAINPTMTINHLKVPRNDGTDYADYLLETEQVNDIAVDSSNRKWVATENSGVYLVSEDGDKIISHYTTDNSDLPSNSVYSVLCDPLNNRVYFGLSTGMISYNSTSSPASDDYSNVYAYPNPVRPDYTGWITISGLMDNSLVKIADSAGNVFYQTRSEGGMVIWDGCGSNGERVKSGVYFVFASQNSDDSNQGVVTKIMVIN